MFQEISEIPVSIARSLADASIFFARAAFVDVPAVWASGSAFIECQAFLHNAAVGFAHLGEWDRAMAIWKKVIKLDPTPPSWTCFIPLFVRYRHGEPEEACKYALVLRQTSMGGWHWVAVWETAVLSDMGRVEEAQETLGRALEAQPDFADTARVWKPRVGIGPTRIAAKCP